MTSQRNSQTVRVVCDECNFSKEVTTRGQKTAEVIVEHGRETGHKLTVEELEDDS